MVHVCLGVTSILLTEFQKVNAFVKVFDYHLCQVPDYELLLLRVLNNTKGIVLENEVFSQQVIDLIIVNLEIRAPDDVNFVLVYFSLAYWFK